MSADLALGYIFLALFVGAVLGGCINAAVRRNKRKASPPPIEYDRGARRGFDLDNVDERKRLAEELARRNEKGGRS